MIKVSVNGSINIIDNSYSVTTLIKELKLEKSRIAVEINNEILPSSMHNKYFLKNGDKIEIIQAVGGG